MSATTAEAAPRRGILVGSVALDRWLHLSLVVLVVASALRYLQGHGWGRDGALVMAGAVLLLVWFAAERRVSGARATAWLTVLVALWTALALVAPSFSWAAVPLVFVALRFLPYRWAVAVTVFQVAVVVVAWSRMTGQLDPTLLLGPICIAVLAVTAYRALDRDAAVRRALLVELEEAQDDIADAERRAGVVGERARLSREIHDSVAQGLTSINLLLRAAEQEWGERPEVARGHVTQAAGTARSSLEEVRHVVRDLAPSELDGAGGSALVEAVERVVGEVARTSGLPIAVHAHGEAMPVSGVVATAVLRTVRGALANVVDHAAAERASVSVTFLDAMVAVDVRDDGVGFDPERALHDRSDGLRGHGLVGLRSRVRDLGGRFAIESSPGEGTVIAATFPRVWARD